MEVQEAGGLEIRATFPPFIVLQAPTLSHTVFLHPKEWGAKSHGAGTLCREYYASTISDSWSDSESPSMCAD